MRDITYCAFSFVQRAPALATITFLSLFLMSLVPQPARAACNAIPAAREKGPYLSTTGGIYQRTAAVGKRILVQNACNSSNVFNKQFPSRNKIEFEFEWNGTVVERVYEELSPGFPDCPAAATDCAFFEFTMPDFTNPSDPDFEKGLVGRTRIKITNLNDPGDADDMVVVEIEELYLPDKTCAKQKKDNVFKEFIVLPKPNVIDSETTFGPEGEVLYGTLDRDGNLLVPFDFKEETQNTALPIATLLSGESSSKGHSNGTSDEQKAFGKRIVAKPDPNLHIRAFDLEGRPLPPLMRMGDDGALFGLVDARHSVLRVERFHRGAPSAKGFFDFSDRVVGKAGPVAFKHKMRLNKRAPVALVGMRSSQQTIAYARDENYDQEDHNGDSDEEDFVPEIVSLTTGKRTKTGVAVATRPVGNALEPVLEVGDAHVGFLSLETNGLGVITGYKQRLYSNSGGELTGSSGEDASNEGRIDGFPVSIGKKGSYFTEPDGVVERFRGARIGGGSSLSIDVPYVEAAMAGDIGVLLVPESQTAIEHHNGDGDTLDNVAHLYMLKPSGDCLVNLELAASAVAISEEIIAIAVSEQGNTIPPSDINVDGDTNDNVLRLLDIAELEAVCNPALSQPQPRPLFISAYPSNFSVDTVGVIGDTAIFIAPENEQNRNVHIAPCVTTMPAGLCDLNHDKDANDRVLMSMTMGNGPRSARLAAEEFVLGDRFVAFRVPEHAQGNTDLNDNKNANDHVMHIYYLKCALPAIAKDTYNTGWSAIPCTFAGCDPRQPYRILDDMVWFVTDDQQKHPLAVTAALATGCSIKIWPWLPKIWPLQAADLPYTIPFSLEFGDAIIPTGAAADGELIVLGDADGDGVPDELDNCVEFPNADLLDVDDDGIGDRYCDPTPAACPPRPLDTCIGSPEVVEDGLCIEGGEDEALEFAWRWPSNRSERLRELGNPIRSLPHYSLCMYAGDREEGALIEGAMLPWPRCGRPPCWKRTRGEGLHFSGAPGISGGIEAATIPAYGDPEPTAWVRGKVEGVRPEELRGRLTVQMIMRDGDRTQCLSSIHAGVRRSLSVCPDPAPGVRAKARGQRRAREGKPLRGS